MCIWQHTQVINSDRSQAWWLRESIVSYLDTFSQFVGQVRLPCSSRTNKHQILMLFHLKNNQFITAQSLMMHK